MSENEAFIAAIAAAPDDDTPRLVYADFLEEHGDAARAGFIRDQVRLAKLRPGGEEYKQLFRRTAETLKANLPAWIQDVCDAFGQPATWAPTRISGRGLSIYICDEFTTQGLGELEFVRGFIDCACITTMFHYSSAQAVTRLFQEPITRLWLSMPGSVEQWQRVTVPGLERIRSLTIREALPKSPSVADAIFATPSLRSLRRIGLDVSPSTLDRFCHSNLSKQVTALRGPTVPASVRVLSRYSLDDRLFEFSLHKFAHQTRHERTPVELLSALSEVAFRPTLKRLDLAGCTIGDRGLAAFARADVWVRLRALVLDRNRFGDPGWRDFVRSRRTPELKLLSASRNFVTGDGAVRLAQSPLAATLEYVDLRGNRIDGKGALALARAMGDGPLKKLLLAGNPIGARDAEMVRKILGERVFI